jgi:hypothetical protein
LPCPRCLAPGDDLERSWLEAVEYEPDWKDVLRVVPIALDGRELSAN